MRRLESEFGKTIVDVSELPERLRRKYEFDGLKLPRALALP
ncbi:MAG: hypothetical protein QXX41_10170 [Nitrososphaerota archaeon]